MSKFKAILAGIILLVGTAVLYAQQPVDITKVAGIAIALGEGVISTGTQRVTIATDDDGVAHLSTIATKITDVEANMAPESTHGSPLLNTGAGILVEASSDLSANTPVDDADAVRAVGDLNGRLINVGPCDRGARIGSVTSVTDGSSTSAITASGANIYNEVWDVIIANTSATAVTVDIRDGTAGSVMATLPVPANTAGVVHRFQVPLTGTANTAVAVDPSAAASTITVTLRGCKAK